MTFFEWFYKVVIVESVCVLLIILSLLTMKYFFKDEFERAEDFYQKNMTVDTDVYEVLSDEN